jgi:hypothetical protein
MVDPPPHLDPALTFPVRRTSYISLESASRSIDIKVDSDKHVMIFTSNELWFSCYRPERAAGKYMRQKVESLDGYHNTTCCGLSKSRRDFFNTGVR